MDGGNNHALSGDERDGNRSVRWEVKMTGPPLSIYQTNEWVACSWLSHCPSTTLKLTCGGGSRSFIVAHPAPSRRSECDLSQPTNVCISAVHADRNAADRSTDQTLQTLQERPIPRTCRENICSDSIRKRCWGHRNGNGGVLQKVAGRHCTIT